MYVEAQLLIFISRFMKSLFICYIVIITSCWCIFKISKLHSWINDAQIWVANLCALFRLKLGRGQLTNLHLTLCYEAWFYKPTILKFHSTICEISERKQVVCNCPYFHLFHAFYPNELCLDKIAGGSNPRTVSCKSSAWTKLVISLFVLHIVSNAQVRKSQLNWKKKFILQN